MYVYTYVLLVSAVPMACGNSQVRDQTWATAVTPATVMTTMPLTARPPGNAQRIYFMHSWRNCLYLFFDISSPPGSSVSFVRRVANLQTNFQFICWKKNPRINGPTKFKPVLFKGQPYFKGAICHPYHHHPLWGKSLTRNVLVFLLLV